MKQEFNELFEIDHDKYHTMFMNHHGIKMMSGNYDSIKEFERVWYRNLPSEERFEVFCDELKSVTKELNSPNFNILASGKFNLPRTCQFAFFNIQASEKFENLLTNYYGLNKQRKNLGKLESITKHILIAVGVSIITLILFLYAPTFQSSNDQIYSYGKSKVVELIVSLLGQNGVVFLGGIITSSILYSAFKRYNKTIVIDLWN